MIRKDRLGLKFTDRSGFHDDLYCIRAVRVIMGHGVAAFVETGSYYGCTAEYMALNFEADVYTCEPNEDHYRKTSDRFDALQESLGSEDNLANVFLSRKLSVDFLKEILPHIADKTCFFYLDAHGYGFKWPLQEEVKLVTSTVENGFIMIDDFKVPGHPQFGYDSYNGQVCGWDHVKNHIMDIHTMWYPTYTENTTVLRAPRGWCLIPFGRCMNEDLAMLDFMEEYDGP